MSYQEGVAWPESRQGALDEVPHNMTSPVTWTTDKPTKPGQYWCQMRDMRPRVVEVVLEQDSHRLTIAQTETYIADLEPENYRWAGPLEPPHDAARIHMDL